MTPKTPRTDWMDRETENAWLPVEAAANAIFKMPELHPADRPEFARDIHDIQNRILTRAAYCRPNYSCGCSCGRQGCGGGTQCGYGAAG